MNKNIVRIIIGSLIGILFLTLLVIFLKKTPLLWTAYAWSIFGIIAFVISLVYWAKSQKNTYILRAPFPMIMWSYLIITISVALVFALLETFGFPIHLVVLCLIEAVVLAVTAWRILAIDAGREEIQRVDQQVKLGTVSWKMIQVEIGTLAENISGDDKKFVVKAAEAIRYADPMEHSAVADVVSRINEKVSALKTAAEEKKSDAVMQLCNEIEMLVKERANKLMILK